MFVRQVLILQSANSCSGFRIYPVFKIVICLQEVFISAKPLINDYKQTDPLLSLAIIYRFQINKEKFEDFVIFVYGFLRLLSSQVIQFRLFKEVFKHLSAFYLKLEETTNIKQGFDSNGMMSQNPFSTSHLFWQSLRSLTLEIPKSRCTMFLSFLISTLGFSSSDRSDTISKQMPFLTYYCQPPKLVFRSQSLPIVQVLLQSQSLENQQLLSSMRIIISIKFLLQRIEKSDGYYYNSIIMNLGKKQFVLKPGKYYMIISRDNQQALRVSNTQVAKHHKSRIERAKINHQDNCQIFLLSKIQKFGIQYQIVSCPSDFVFQSDHQVTLHHGKRGKDQLFSFVQILNDQSHTYFTIKCANKPGYGLEIDGVLKQAILNTNIPRQQFRFQEIADNNTILNSCVIINNYSGRVLDVPNSSDKAGERIIIWDRNNRWNQRWVFQYQGGAFYIRNLKNGLYLDIAGESRQNGAKVVQWSQTKGTNQQWQVQTLQNNLYKIWSCHEPSLFLGIKKQDGQNGSYLEVGKKENPTLYWKIDGARPK